MNYHPDSFVLAPKRSKTFWQSEAKGFGEIFRSMQQSI
jgi:hypothetical protein